MTLNDLQNEVLSDLKINGADLSFEAHRTPDIHHKYNKMMMAERRALKKLEREYDKLYLDRWEYYRKKSDPEVYLKEPLLKKIIDTDVKLYIAADKQMQDHRTKIEDKEELIDFLKRTLDQIAQRTWLIRNSIENNKYLNGDRGPIE